MEKYEGDANAEPHGQAGWNPARSRAGFPLAELAEQQIGFDLTTERVDQL